MNAINQIESPFGAITVTQINGQPMVDGVQLAAFEGKQIRHWLQLKATKKLISALESTKGGIPRIVIEESVFTPGVGKTPQRVWLCERLVYDLTYWMSTDFRLKCLDIITAFFRGELAPVLGSSLTVEQMVLDKIHAFQVRTKADVATLDALIGVLHSENVCGVGKKDEVEENPHWRDFLGRLSGEFLNDDEEWCYIRVKEIIASALCFQAMGEISLEKLIGTTPVQLGISFGKHMEFWRGRPIHDTKGRTVRYFKHDKAKTRGYRIELVSPEKKQVNRLEPTFN